MLVGFKLSIFLSLKRSLVPGFDWVVAAAGVPVGFLFFGLADCKDSLAIGRASAIVSS